MEARKFLPILTLATVVALLALIWFFPPTGDFRVGNPFWNGYSEFSGRFNATAIYSFGDLPSNSSASVLLEVPYVQFKPAELSSLFQFVAQGGTLVLMDDYGFGNDILGYFGVNASLSGKPLLDPLYHFKNSLFPRISSFDPPLNITGNVAMDRGTALITANPSGVLAWSSGFSFLDQNGDSVKSSGDASGPLPVAYMQQVGYGMIVVVSDPSLIINSMINVDGNSALATRLANLKSNHSTLYVDQSHLPREPLDDAKLILAGAYALLTNPIITLALIAVILTLSTLPFWKKNKTIKT
jgi:hypothetical protein